MVKTVSNDERVLARVDDVVEGELLGVEVDDIELVLVNVEGSIRVFEGRCPHMGALLAEGELEAGQVVCRVHQWRFDGCSGAKVDDPAICLKSLPVSIVDGQVVATQTDLQAVGRHNRAPFTKSCLPGEALPGPRPWPLVGSLLSIDRQAFHLTLEAWARQYGDIYQVRLATTTAIIVSDEGIVNELFKARPGAFRRSSQLELVSISGMNTEGVFMAEGERWHKQRPVIMESLDTRHLKQFYPLLLSVTERLGRRWRLSAGQSVDVQADLMRFTVDVTTSLAFGQDINTLEAEGDVIQKHLDKIFPTIQRRLLTPFPYWQYFKLPVDREAERSARFVMDEVGKIVADCRALLQAQPHLREQPENLLQSLLVAVDDESRGFSEKEMVDNVTTMLLAGEDTTANSLAWAIYFLVKYPAVQTRLREEIKAALGDGLPTSGDQLRALPYLDGVIHESMRLKPVAPINGLEANEDFVATGTTLKSGLALRKGDFIIALTRVMASREADFPEPGAFRPERWLPENRANQVNQRAFIPFGSGPRLCPGRSLALLEMKLVLVMILQQFEIEARVDFNEVKEALAFTMSPVGLRAAFIPVEEKSE
ncbi:MAG TPA: cytochrome P450 [Porticoccaceae bacterium]|nr:cytochrome P450 [Porticoccaceae bacterium]